MSPFAFAHVIPNGTYFVRHAASHNQGELPGLISQCDGERESDV